MALTFESRLNAKLCEALKEEIQRLEQQLGLGLLEDFAAYKYIVGQIAGLRVALEVADSTEKQLLGLTPGSEHN